MKLNFLNLNPRADCSCPACAASGPHTSPLRRFLNHNPKIRLIGFTEVEGGSNGVPDVADLKAAVEARQLATSKNIQNRPGPPPLYPARPESSPFTDVLARDAFDVGRTVPEPPTDDQLRAAMKAHRGEK